MDRDTELALVEGLRRGETSAFDAVYDAYRAQLFAFLLRLSRRRAVAEDLLDETWLRLVRHARGLQPDTRLAPWLFTVARNLYWSHRRACLLEETLDHGLPGLWPSRESWPSPFDLALAAETQRRLEEGLARLPPQHREVLLLVAAEGLTPTEAAGVCGVRPEAMRQRLARARAALAEELGASTGEAIVTKRRFGT
ncbi:MAG TPA: RNA polymerase sigma factor [Vicinamibacterales bacterium]|nr:RNA polymerase sigma factor [Vicinamibacterales bacterium]